MVHQSYSLFNVQCNNCVLLAVHYQLHYLLTNGVTPIVKVIVENCWHPWMSQYVSISLQKSQSKHKDSISFQFQPEKEN